MWKMQGELRAELRALLARMDEEVARFQGAYEHGGGKIYCGRGCPNCCRLPVHATFFEALLAAETLTEGPLEGLGFHARRLKAELGTVADPLLYVRRYREIASFCPFLDDAGGCGIYDARPFSCRALLSTRNPDWCAVDLGTLHPWEKAAFLSSLDRSVVAFPTHYAASPQIAGREMESLCSLIMARQCGFSLSGNFALLVWLIRERGLAQKVAQGKEVTSEFLEGEGIAGSFLVTPGC